MILRKLLTAIKYVQRIAGVNRDISYVTIGVVAGNFVAGVLWFFLASYLPVNDYGRITYILAISSISSTISLFGFNTSTIAFTSQGKILIVRQLNSLILILSILSAFVLYLVFHSIIIAFLTITSVFAVMSIAILLGQKKYKEFMYTTIGQKISQLVLTVLFYNIFHSSEYALLGYGIGSLLLSFRYLSTVVKFQFKFEALRSQISLIMHSYSYELAKSIVYFDRLLVAPFFGFFVLGQYQIGLQFLLFLGMIPQILFNYLLPEAAGGLFTRRIMYTGVLISLLSYVTFFLLCPVVVETFFPKFVNSITPIRLITMGVIPQSITSIQSTRFLGTEKSKHIFVGAIIFVAVQYTGIIFLGALYGVMGLSIATLLSTFSQAAYLSLMARRT